jgi:hypothetical protein
MVVDVIFFPVTWLIIVLTISKPLALGTRIRVNILYCGQLVFYIYFVRIAWFRAAEHDWLTWCEIWVHCIAAGMFGVAALLCSIAGTTRHAWVTSRLLGGTGIEPMVLMLPGRGPLYQSVGDEAREGAIRLV